MLSNGIPILKCLYIRKVPTAIHFSCKQLQTVFDTCTEEKIINHTVNSSTILSSAPFGIAVRLLTAVTKFILTAALIVSFLLSSNGCSSIIRHTAQSPPPSWVVHRPHTRSHFTGIGSAEIQTNLYDAQVTARKRALLDIAEQIQISIHTDAHFVHRYGKINGKTQNNHLYREQIQTFSHAVLSGWEERHTWRSSDGYVWSNVILDKKKYYETVDRKMTDAITQVRDILYHSQQGTALQCITQLHKGLLILDAFSSIPLKATVHGKEVILSQQLHRQLQSTLSQIQIIATDQTFQISATQPLSEIPGVRVYFKGIPDNSLKLAWSASNHKVNINTVSSPHKGIHKPLIRTLPASCGWVNVTAVAEFYSLGYDLIRRKFNIPSVSFAIRRESARVYIGQDNSFCRQLVRLLAAMEAITIVTSAQNADYILSSCFVGNEQVTLENSIYIAEGKVTVILTKANGKYVINYTKHIRSADGISASRARNNTQKYALSVALKKVELVL